MPVVRTDPIRNFKFEVSFIPLNQNNEGSPSTVGLDQFAQGINKLGFAAMSGLSVRNEMIP